MSKKTEKEVAIAALALAEEAKDNHDYSQDSDYINTHIAHVGYLLLILPILHGPIFYLIRIMGH